MVTTHMKAKHIPIRPWVVIAAGGLMGMCFAFMWVVTMYQLWFSPPPPMVSERERVDIPTVG